MFDRIGQQNLPWGDEKTLKFILSISFRYAVHFLETSPIYQNTNNNIRFRGLSYSAIGNIGLIGVDIFIYPYIFRPITNSCSLIIGINHFLNLSFHAVSLPAEEDLPNAFLIILPSMLFLLTDGYIKFSRGNRLVNTQDIKLSTSIDVQQSNVNMPEFVGSILNRSIGQTQAHQRTMHLWKKIAYGTDKLLHPNKFAYKCQKWDGELLAWQQRNCG